MATSTQVTGPKTLEDFEQIEQTLLQLIRNPYTDAAMRMKLQKKLLINNAQIAKFLDKHSMKKQSILSKLVTAVNERFVKTQMFLFGLKSCCPAETKW